MCSTALSARPGSRTTVRLAEALQRYVMHHRWPGWVAQTLKDPLADRIIDVFRGPKVRSRWPSCPAGSGERARCGPCGRGQTGRSSGAGRGLAAGNLGVDGGLPPRRPRGIDPRQSASQRPPLVVCERPKEIGPDGSTIVERPPRRTPGDRERTAPHPTGPGLVPEGDRAVPGRAGTAARVVAGDPEMVQRRAVEPGAGLGSYPPTGQG